MVSFELVFEPAVFARILGSPLPVDSAAYQVKWVPIFEIKVMATTIVKRARF
jgi:hypothetical protein